MSFSNRASKELKKSVPMRPMSAKFRSCGERVTSCQVSPLRTNLKVLPPTASRLASSLLALERNFGNTRKTAPDVSPSYKPIQWQLNCGR